MNPGWRLLPDNKALGWTPYAWLIYLPTFLIDPITRTFDGAASAGYWLLTIGALLLFLASYFYGYWVSDKKLFAVISLQTTLAMAFAGINNGSFVFFIYAASFAAQLQNRQAWFAVIGIALLAAVTAAAVDAQPFFWIGGTVITAMVGAVNIHFAAYARTQRQLRLAENEVRHLAAVAERERIARDLHDVLGHTLSLIVLKSELASKLMNREPDRAAQEVTDIESVARRALQDVRETIRGMRPSLDDELARAAAMLRAAGVQATIRRAPIDAQPAVEETLSYLVREAVTNVARHAQARSCSIDVLQQNGSAMLRIRDDGRAAQIREGNGMRGMRERVEVLGGRLQYQAADGLEIQVELPVQV